MFDKAITTVWLAWIHPQADFKSRYDHGIADASDPCNNPRVPCLAYVWKSPNGFINQTNEGRSGPKSADWMVGETLTGTYTSKFPSRNLPNLH